MFSLTMLSDDFQKENFLFGVLNLFAFFLLSSSLLTCTNPSQPSTFSLHWPVYLGITFYHQVTEKLQEHQQVREWHSAVMNFLLGQTGGDCGSFVLSFSFHIVSVRVGQPEHPTYKQASVQMWQEQIQMCIPPVHCHEGKCLCVVSVI